MAGPTTLSGVTMGNIPSSTAGKMGIDVSFDPSPLVIAAAFDKMSLDIRSFKEPLKRSVQQVIIPSIRKNFESGGRPRWAPLVTDTETIREYYGFSSGPPLIRSGLLQRAATQLNIWTIDTQQAYVNDLSAAQGGRVWYGVLQQNGFVGGYGAKTPARPFLMIQEEDTVEIEEVFLTWVEERMVEAGFDLSTGVPV